MYKFIQRRRVIIQNLEIILIHLDLYGFSQSVKEIAKRLCNQEISFLYTAKYLITIDVYKNRVAIFVGNYNP